MSLISPTTLFVAGSISITLSPAELVWTIRTVDACSVRVVRMARASTAESLVVIIYSLAGPPRSRIPPTRRAGRLRGGYSRRRPTHFKLHGHVADPLFNADPSTVLDPRFRLLQDEGAAAAPREAAGARPLLDVPLAKHGLPAAGAAEGAHRVHRGGVA